MELDVSLTSNKFNVSDEDVKHILRLFFWVLYTAPNHRFTGTTTFLKLCPLSGEEDKVEQLLNCVCSSICVELPVKARGVSSRYVRKS
jgi:hypothetical protein